MKQLFLLLVICVLPLHWSWAQCMDDCVWPGDLNANGIANNLDVLAIGLTIGKSGPARSNTSTMWEALEAENWAESLPVTGANHKHCDSDGNGLITIDDQWPINFNYNQTNDKFSGLLGHILPGDDLFIVPQNTVASPGGSLFFDVHLGSAAQPINDIYGIGFQLKIDTQYVENVLYDFSDSWIGSGDDILGYGKFSDEADHSATTITRLTGDPVSGFGKIASIEIVIIDVILGLEMDSTACLPFPLEFENVLGIGVEENDLLITSQNDSMNLKHPSQLTTSTKEVETIANWSVQVFPNPAQDLLHLRSQGFPFESIQLFNQLGQCILHQNWDPTKDSILEWNTAVDNFPPGIYYLKIMSGIYQQNRKVMIE